MKASRVQVELGVGVNLTNHHVIRQVSAWSLELDSRQTLGVQRLYRLNFYSLLKIMSEHDASSSTPVQISIKPCRSAYFAGERLSVIIQVSNTRRSAIPLRQNALLSPATGRSQHRRSSHSISSAPISRPPTSPGAQKPASPTTTPLLSTFDPNVRRTGRIGIRHQRRSLSVNTIAVSELIGEEKSSHTRQYNCESIFSNEGTL